MWHRTLYIAMPRYTTICFILFLAAPERRHVARNGVLAPTCSRGTHGREFGMAVQTFRHAAKLSLSGHCLPDRLFAMHCNAFFEERTHARRMSIGRASQYDPFGSLTAIRNRDPEWQGISVPVVRSALARLDQAAQEFFRGTVARSVQECGESLSARQVGRKALRVSCTGRGTGPR